MNMMKKRIALLLGTFSILLLAFVVYNYASEGTFPRPWSFDRPVGRPVGDSTKLPGGLEVESIPPSSFSQYDEEHRLQAVYMFRGMQKRGGRYYMDEPQVNWYLKSGELAVIRARRGIFRINQVGNVRDVRDGELTGNVRIVMDRRIRPGPEPLAERQDDAVRIYTDEVTFDRDRLMIETDRQVVVFSKEADILGTGLRLSWSDSPRELRELRIIRGEYLCIREGQDRFMEQLSLPGGATEEADPAEAPEPGAAVEPPAPRASLAERREVGWVPPVGRGLVMAAFTATRPTASRAATTRPRRVATRPAGAEPAEEPTGAPGGPPPIIEDTYRIVFSDNVEVTSGQRYLRGAEKLALVFEYADPREREKRRAEKRPAGAVPPTGAAASPPVAARSPAGEPSTPRPPAAEPEPPPEPMIVTWTGPLVITPVREPEEHIPDRFDVEASGRKLDLGDGEATTICRSFQFRSLSNSGELLGWKGEPVRMRMATGERISAPVVRFNRDEEWVRFVGAGGMSMPAGESDILGVGDVAAEEGAEEAGDVTITWTDHVLASIGRQEVTTDAGTERRDFLCNATFTGKVIVKQPPGKSLQAHCLKASFHEPKSADDTVNRIKLLDAQGQAKQVHLADAVTGEYTKADNLRVTMATSPGGKSYPLEAVATGNVSARQVDQEVEGGEVTVEAEKVTVKFALVKDPLTGEEKPQGRRMVATGKVKVTGVSEADPMVAQCDKLIADRVAGTAKLIGKPAVVTEKDNILKAGNIFLSRKKELGKKTESAKVTGPGTLRFWTDTDLSGNKVDKPRRADIIWTKSLDYYGAKRLAVVAGGVELATAEDLIKCGKMDVTFAAEKETAAKPAAEEGSQRFRQRKIAQVIAHKSDDEDVELLSVQKDADGYLERRLLLCSGQVIYEAAVKAVRCPKAGMLLVEDYRPPEPPEKTPPGKKPAPAKKPAPEGELLGVDSVTRPSQSRFQWSKSMYLDQDKRVVELRGDVHLDHCSGKHIVGLKELNVRAIKDMPRGRNTSLDCDRMLATFAKPDLSAITRPAEGTTGPRVGKLMLFDARGDVNLKDGRQEVVCQRMLWQRETDVAVIWGYLVGQRPKDAVIYYEDKTKGRLYDAKSPNITWNRKTNRVVTGRVEAHGG